MALVPAGGETTYRVAQTSYGALAPLARPLDFTEVGTWARWDTAGGRTVYSAESELAAYLEVLAYYRPATNMPSRARAFPDSDDPDDHSSESVYEQISREQQRTFGDFGPGNSPNRWREARSLYTLTLPSTGWFIDICHHNTIAALNRAAGSLGGPFLPSERVTLNHLTSEDRAWTCEVATRLREARLDDGSHALGIRYLSKHGTPGLCWATWLRGIDIGHPTTDEAVQVTASHGIGPAEHDPALDQATTILDLH